MSRRLISLSIAAVTLVGLGGLGIAGSKWMNSLTIGQNGISASGGFAETYNTPDVTEYAECGSNHNTGFCTFVDSNGTNYACFTTDPGAKARRGGARWRTRQCPTAAWRVSQAASSAESNRSSMLTSRS